MMKTAHWLRTVTTGLAAFTLFLADAVAGSSPAGYWTTIDDDGKTPTGIIKIEERDHKLVGTLVSLINPDTPNPTCDKCDGSKRGKPVLGMQIIWGLEADGEEWSGGYILDPKNGKEYRCYLEVEDGGAVLKVRGYVGISLLGRTQHWKRAKGPNAN